jgi:hypothetical protein
MPKSFRLTEDHLRLLRKAVVSWDGCEFGAPAIDCKRPYGNSDVPRDIAEILGIDWAAVEDKTHERLRALHEETETALEIVLRTGSFRPGHYVTSSAYTRDWRLA